MTEKIFLDEQNYSDDRTDEIFAIIDDITAKLMTMSREERIAWFRRTQYPHPVNFETEIDGTVYSVTTHFNKDAKETLVEKTERIILRNM